MAAQFVMGALVCVQFWATAQLRLNTQLHAISISDNFLTVFTSQTWFQPYAAKVLNPRQPFLAYCFPASFVNAFTIFTFASLAASMIFTI
jgi:hypothetical protein